MITNDEEYDDDFAELNTGGGRTNVRKSSGTNKPEKYNRKGSRDEYFCHFRCVAGGMLRFGYLSCSMLGVVHRYLTLSQPERRDFETVPEPH